MNNKEILEKGAKELGLYLNEYQIQQFLKYKDLLIEWNEKINLTAITEEKEVMIKHFLDSISCISLPYIKENSKVIDVGTGAGFPGIPIHIYYPNVRLTLLDSLKKRINFLKEVCENLGLESVNFEHGRAEDFGKDKNFREKYDIAVARAVAQLNVLCEYCLPFVKVGGYFVCQKGPNIDEEMKDAKKAIEILGGKFIEKKDIKLPFSQIRHNVVVIQKIKETSTKYPRKAGTPTKKPL
ncbi:16S rRNA (guanine(527)-N(7))-methyltransferase RsmG [Crassaminicella thermophila]|uniref:Ribosomal RNA small subunit methyltransferase G n=1 Tax=Crassaminicella thermophila TaxID=2599308 RepID=A0A5C0SK16_CRATE|nr:16S rRNA (guanine(527)-N(7))-methyltransferase RsmG [Crassaminicella thermophila]QEK13528.1 16S rRNA (guanine(527)-N(7))-methyltransferase RsmG [Crassaminicella thermophila]